MTYGEQLRQKFVTQCARTALYFYKNSKLFFYGWKFKNIATKSMSGYLWYGIEFNIILSLFRRKCPIVVFRKSPFSLISISGNLQIR